MREQPEVGPGFARRVQKAHETRVRVGANAGIAERMLAADVTPKHFDRLFAVNVRSALFTIQRAIPLASRPYEREVRSGVVASPRPAPLSNWSKSAAGSVATSTRERYGSLTNPSARARSMNASNDW
jgi:NAD(P)-dependent dehydrogenase (short-subunit alcohol dehydrogenase family)